MMASVIDCAPLVQHNVAALGRALVQMTPSPCASPQHVIRGAHTIADSTLYIFMTPMDAVAQQHAVRVVLLDDSDRLMSVLVTDRRRAKRKSRIHAQRRCIIAHYHTGCKTSLEALTCSAAVGCDIVSCTTLPECWLQQAAAPSRCLVSTQAAV
jgi:hypothetical protein